MRAIEVLENCPGSALRSMHWLRSRVLLLACEVSGVDQLLIVFQPKRRLYSATRLGREALVRRWLPLRLSHLVVLMRNPCSQLFDHVTVTA